MIVKTPKLNRAELLALEKIWLSQRDIASLVSEPNLWTGTLRRQTLGRAIQASNSIEGISGSLGQIQELILGTETSTPTSDAADLLGYQRAMNFVLQLARDGQIEFDQNLIKALHFNLLSGSAELDPGRYRKGPIYVVDGAGRTVHQGAPAESVSGLMADLVELANSTRDEVTLVGAAMVHLNLALIHPFKDGNGRMARILQSASLTSDVKLSPVFLSIEEYLASNTDSYYRVLAEVGQGSWNSRVDALPWVRFVLEAHWQQIARVRQTAESINRAWVLCADLCHKLGLNERAVPALTHVATGFELSNSSYRGLLAEAHESVTLLTASRDLALLVELRVLSPSGSTRARSYSAGPKLKAVASKLGSTHARVEPLFS